MTELKLLAAIRWLLRFILLFVFLLSVTLSLQCLARDYTQYDDQIKAAWRRYLPTYHWGYGWAQMMQESAANPNAISPVGAEGLAQFMPLTWQDMQRAKIVPLNASPRDARHAIQAQAYYMYKLVSFWHMKRPQRDKLNLALASYNAGAGNLIKAQKHCNNARLYKQIIYCLEKVTGRHSKETKHYVYNIHKIYLKRFYYYDY